MACTLLNNELGWGRASKTPLNNWNMAATISHPGQQVNYGPEAEDSEEFRPHPNPEAWQQHPQVAFKPPPLDEKGEFQAKTIGDALEEAARKCQDKILELKDVRAIQSAEARATGVPSGVLGGPAAYAYGLFENSRKATLGDALKDVKHYLPADKVVTERDARRIRDAEARNDPLGQISPNGVAACVEACAEYNMQHGLVPMPSPTSIPRSAMGRAGLGFVPGSPGSPRSQKQR